MQTSSFLLIVVLSIIINIHGRPTFLLTRGCEGKSIRKSDAYYPLAVALKSRVEVTDIKLLEKTLKSLSTTQKAFKGLDGAAHEAYQRTFSSFSNNELTSVVGRARRSASRTASTADAFLTAELCELVERDQYIENSHSEDGALWNRQILLKTNVRLTKGSNVTVLVLWEPSYDGGAGVNHGGIKDLARTTSKEKKGRFLVILKDSANNDLKETFDILDSEPLEVELKSGLVANEIASVQIHLYRCAGRVLREIRPLMSDEKLINKTKAAFHFVGQSLGGGVASLAAVILDGSLPMPQVRKQQRKNKSDADRVDGNITTLNLDGWGRGRSSATVLGSPPSLSANVKAAFIKSIIYGDDVICRTTQKSLERLCQRTRRFMKGSLLGRNLDWMTDAASLTITNVKYHARGSDGEETRLVVPGQAFLIRPRRLRGVCSMHEVGCSKGGREALRSAILWQLNDILLSESCWKHHQLKAYIEGLDKVQLRGAGNI